MHMKLQSSTKVLARLPSFADLSWKFISSASSPQFNVVYRDEVVIARFQHCQGGRGFLIPVMPLVIVSKIACQRMFQLSDPGVPRIFVEDFSHIASKKVTRVMQIPVWAG